VNFVQIIEMHTKNVDQIMKLEDEWEKATEGKRTLRRSIVTRDRNDPDRYLVFAFFDDYDSAMVNSKLPETAEFGQKQTALLDGPMQFTDLDIVEDRPSG
jgi:quinol monooxygenase YgiN